MTTAADRVAATDESPTAAYAVCRAIARREAKNFYYAFRVLPRAKSDAMCAVYAFMRQADDIADDESTTMELRRERMTLWMSRWRASRRASHGTGESSESSSDPIFRALGDAQERFAIPDDLLEQLVCGTSMDLEGETDRPGGGIALPGGLHGYATFDDLYCYCYLVASVVGLVCIRIFGYTDPAAELLAEKLGVAFQLTNILRDVKEDAERGRIYLPQTMMGEFGVSNEDVLELSRGRPMRSNERAMNVALSVQAWEYYEAARELLPMIDADSRGALSVLIRIYSGLLSRIDRHGGDVFTTRVSVPVAHKVFAVLRGAVMTVGART